MALPKFSKADTTRLIKFVSYAKFSFNPFDVRGTAVQEIMQRLMVSRFTESNPKLKYDVDTHARPTAPYLEFRFIDGSKYVVDPAVDIKIEDVLMEMNHKAETVFFEFQLDGKDPETDAIWYDEKSSS